MSQLVQKLRSKTGILLFAIISVLIMSVAYAALNTDLSISGDAYVRVDEDIRITELKMIEATNGAYEIYNSKYSKDSTSMFVALPNTDSTITYEVTVVNNTSIRYQLKDIIKTSFTNKNINYEIIGLSIDEIIPKNTTVKFQVKFTTNLVNQETNVLLNYVFEKFTSITLVEPYANVKDKFHSVQPRDEATGVYYGWPEYLGVDMTVILVSFRGNKLSVFSNELIDVTNIETISFDLRLVANDVNLSFITYIGLIDPSTEQDTDHTKFTRVQSISKVGTEISDHIITLDVSDLTGKYYLKFTSIHGGEHEACTGFTAIRSIQLK